MSTIIRGRRVFPAILSWKGSTESLKIPRLLVFVPRRTKKIYLSQSLYRGRKLQQYLIHLSVRPQTENRSLRNIMNPGIKAMVRDGGPCEKVERFRVLHSKAFCNGETVDVDARTTHRRLYVAHEQLRGKRDAQQILTLNMGS